MQMLNRNVRSLDMSGGLYDIYQKALKMEAEGKSIIHMEIGRPDFDSPQRAKDGVIEALNRGEVYYTAMVGIPEVRQAICEKEWNKNGLKVDPDGEIIVTAGGCEAILSVLMSIMDPEDAIMIPSPYFTAYEEMARIIGVELVDVPLKLENGFELHVEDLEEYYNDRVKVILVNTPSNPSGAIIREEELRKIAEFAKEKDLIVLSDETYDQFLFEGVHKSIATLPGMRERTIVVNSTSKTFSMTGWRVGYCIVPRDILPYVNKVHQNMSTCATSFVQYGVADAYRYCDDFTKGMVDEFRIRRDILCDGLRKCKGVDFVVPKGAFYIFPRIASFGLTSREFCNRLLDETGIASTPGNTFGKAGEGFFRLAFGCSREQVTEAAERLIDFTNKL